MARWSPGLEGISHQEMALIVMSMVAHAPSIGGLLDLMHHWNVAGGERYGNFESISSCSWQPWKNSTSKWWQISPFMSASRRIASPNAWHCEINSRRSPKKACQGWMYQWFCIKNGMNTAWMCRGVWTGPVSKNKMKAFARVPQESAGNPLLKFNWVLGACWNMSSGMAVCNWEGATKLIKP